MRNTLHPVPDEPAGVGGGSNSQAHVTMEECTVSHQVLKELYHEIYKLHWSYLELEEGLQKLEEQKMLEALLKKFLCLVPHNRKFYLPETFKVFKNTVMQMKDFSVVKMLNGFESISQYANNLFTKPWRKEYRTIKMYSGFFIHEINSNLVDSEELFIAMGYKKTANHELVLDGEICPDQVMNMSRDAMTAYTECKILNRIYSELTSTYKISCTWADVFNYREQHTGGVTDTIEAMRNSVQRNVCAREKQMPQQQQPQTQLGPCYSSNGGVLPGTAATGAQLPACIASTCNASNEYFGGTNYHPHQTMLPPPQQQPITMQPQAHHHHHYHPQQSHNHPAYEQTPPVDLMTNPYYYHQPSQHHHRGPNGSLSSAVAMSSAGPSAAGVCELHPQLSSGLYSTSAGHGNMRMSNQHPSHPVYASHSNHPARQSQQGSSCLDYAPHTAMPHSKSMDHYSYPTVLDDHLTPIDHHHHHHHSNPYEGPSAQFSRSHGNMNGLVAGNSGPGYYEPMPVAPPPQQQQQQHLMNCGGNPTPAAAYNVSGTRYPLPYSISAQFASGSGVEGHGEANWGGGYYEVPNGQPGMIMADNGGMSYAPANDCVSHGHQRTSLPRSVAAQAQPQYYSELKPVANHLPHRGYGESSDEVDRYGPPPMVNVRGGKMKDQEQQTPRTSDFDSYEELFGDQQQPQPQRMKAGDSGARSNNYKNNSQNITTSNKPRPDKIQDGVGSFESWDYVYQSLDQETRRPPPPVETEVMPLPPPRQTNGKAGVAVVVPLKETAVVQRGKTVSKQEHMSNLRAVKPASGDYGVTAAERRGERKSSTSGHQHQKSNSVGGTGPTGSLLVANGSASHHQRQSSDSGLNGGHRVTRSNGGVSAAAKRRPEKEETSSFPVESLPPPVITQDEWSCRFCTYLNEHSRRICEMCAKSKDFNLESNGSATCV